MKIQFEDFLWLFPVSILILLPAFQVNVIGTQQLFNEKKYFEIGVLILFGLTILFIRKYRHLVGSILAQLPQLSKVILLLIILMGVISSYNAEFRSWAYLEVGHYLFIGIISLMIAALSFKNPDKAVNYISAAVIGAVLFYLFRFCITYILYQFANYPLWPGSETEIGHFGFSDKRFFNHIQTWTLPLLISIGWYYYKHSKQALGKVGFLILITGWIILILASGARGTVLGVTVGFALLFLKILGNNNNGILKYAIITSLAGIISYWFLFNTFIPAGPDLNAGTTLLRESSSGRIEVWKGLIPDILQHPFLGYGPMHYASVILDNVWSSPHSWFVQFAYEWGLPVAIMLLGIFTFGIVCFGDQVREDFEENKYSNRKLWFKFGLLWSLLSVFIHSFFSGLFNTPLSQLWFILIVGASMGIYFYDRKKKFRYSPMKSEMAVIALVTIALASFIQWGASHNIDQEELHDDYLRTYETRTFYPRYWQQGKIGIDYDALEESRASTAKN